MTMAEKMTSSNDLTDLTEGVQDVCCDSNSNLQAVTGDAVSETASLMVTASRDQARKLQSLSYDERQTILFAVAEGLESQKATILAANAIDLKNAQKDGTAQALVRRLKLTDAKLATLNWHSTNCQ